jgi:hypothetical protein
METVRFNAGGKIYEVSRSLLGQPPRPGVPGATVIVSPEQETAVPMVVMTMPRRDGSYDDEGEKKKDDDVDAEGNNSNALFIERDGERFRYCLDYMRDGGVVGLPPSISKDAMLQDLSYYGFQEVDSSSISVKMSLSILWTCLDHIKSLGKYLDDRISDLEWK